MSLLIVVKKMKADLAAFIEKAAGPQ